MSKTPRTDAGLIMVEIRTPLYGAILTSQKGVVDASFARQLETELADARAEIERLKCCTNCGSRLWAATGKGNCKNCKDFNRWTSQSIAALAAERGE